MATSDSSVPIVDADRLVDPAIELVKKWLLAAEQLEDAGDRASMQRLGDLVRDDGGVGFVMQFVDRVARPDEASVAAVQLGKLVAGQNAPAFLSTIDRLLLRIGAKVAPLAPRIVMALAGRRMRSIVGHLVAPGESDRLARHLGSQRTDGFACNVNLLGEAVLGEREADRRLRRLKELVALPDIDYVSVKITAVASQINHWAHAESLHRLTDRLSELVDAAAASKTATFVNFDMEEFHDLHLTVEAFKGVLGSPQRQHLDAGIVIQAYLPDSLEILQDLTQWASDRYRRAGGTVKIRLVKGANLAMEQVESALHGWDQAPFGSKIESDAGYRSCIDWVLKPSHLEGVRIGVASHNLFDVAWAKLIAEKRGVLDRIQFEMLQGMAPGQAKAVNADSIAAGGAPTLLYTPAVAKDDFDVAIGYLFRRLEENAAEDNYLRHVFDLAPGSRAFEDQSQLFRDGTALRHALDHGSRRWQDRSQPAAAIDPTAPFANEADTDACLPSNRRWIEATLERTPEPCATAMTTDVAIVRQELAGAAHAQAAWAARPSAERRLILHRVAAELGNRRGELLATMMHEASKTLAQGDVEVSEAIDFARYYGDQAMALDSVQGATFAPFGVVAVIPPWNFPTAIPAGGVLASLAAGNAVVLKPAPQTPRCAELVAEACWAAGVPTDVLRFVRTGDDDAGRTIVEEADAVILTGSSETADLFLSWKPDLRLFAETSGKNVLIVTPSADIDLAVEDLVQSAFGHGGQKCSAASLAILVGDVATSERFRRQLVDAVESLSLGPSSDPGTDIAPLVDGGNERLDRAVGQLDAGESWLVQPSIVAPGHVTPGVRQGVQPGSWFHRTECFGPVLGLMAAPWLDDAIEIANSSDFGLTGGIHSLDPTEVRTWAERIQIGNGYVNRAITGAIVQRQPFGGWKRSAVGPGAKAGGPNYLMQLGTWSSDDVADDYDLQWQEEFGRSHDPSALFCEANIFRYRPLRSIGVVFGPEATPRDRDRMERLASRAGVNLAVAPDGLCDHDATRATWLADLAATATERVRFVGLEPSASDHDMAAKTGLHLITGPITAAGRIEFQHLVREQAMSITLHRFGNLVNASDLRLP
jgi:RHH-type proline utilization regulon transcriptional repressor/proline dehydrogenase/delta 1-pyrroline-5-carboxylate dehydrogenase